MTSEKFRCLPAPRLHIVELRMILRRFACIAVITATFMPLGGRHAAAQCVSSSTTQNCSDVPAGGIAFTSGVTTVNVADGAPGVTSLNNSTVGILLSQSGVDGSAGLMFTSNDTTSTIPFDADNDPDTPNVNVVTDSSGTAPLFVGADVIIVNGDGTFTVGSMNFADDAALQSFLEEQVSVSTGGGASGSLTVNNPGSFPGAGAPFVTSNASGIVAQSTGGNGGNGGVINLLLVEFGQDGESGGDGGSVAVNSDSLITVNGGTSGQRGVSATSQGGAGGSGGGFFALIVSDPGAGGDGGDGGAVSVNLGANSAISTFNTDGIGVFALSRGGDGGAGGSSGGAVLLGSEGGDAGVGSTVSVVNGGSVFTSGAGAHAIYAASIGAGAGDGGGGGGLVAIGGGGGGTANGGNVTVTTSGNLTTTNGNAHGVFAQSVGGGGGDGGSTVGLAVGIGGRAGSSGNGGTVAVNQAGTSRISTSGTASYGIFAQSVGGGGGAAGFGGGIVALGGDGGAAGNGSTVTVNTAAGAAINTSGQSAHGILAQSIGGGGGSGGTGGGVVGVGASGGSSGSGGVVVVDTGADITTGGIDARGIFAQSIGGGGGSANGTGGLVSVGGSGSGGGSARRVDVDNAGNITTIGIGSDAIFAQSVGGGGGAGAASGGAVSIGGSSDSGGNGGLVNVSSSGALSTSSTQARGIFAQSVGGGSGGASGGLTSIGGAAGAASNGGSVTVSNSGSINTGGVSSSGIQAQSVGGGGGDGGTSGGALLTIGGTGGGGGASGPVTVGHSGSITTTGADSHGIFVQSVGGGGGNGGGSFSGSAFAGVAIGGSGGAGGAGGVVNVNFAQSGGVDPTISTGGARARAVFAQSVGGGGNGGYAVSVAASGGIGGSVSTSIGIGGSGSEGGGGGMVRVNSGGSITTGNDFSNGLMAQSVGGGGRFRRVSPSPWLGRVRMASLALSPSVLAARPVVVAMAESLTLITPETSAPAGSTPTVLSCSPSAAAQELSRLGSAVRAAAAPAAW